MTDCESDPSRVPVERLQRFFYCAVAANVAGLTALWLAAPTVRARLTAENGEMETAGAALLLGGFFVGIVRAGRVLADRKEWFALSIPHLCLVAFLDEISFGRVYFGGEAWRVMGYECDGVHDLFSIGMKLWRDRGWLAFDVALFGLIGVGVILAYVGRRFYMPAMLAYIRRHPAFDYVRVAVILFGVSLLLDVDIVRHPFALFLEELLEMNLGLALLFAAGAIEFEMREAGCG